jgi:hypothetical protein
MRSILETRYHTEYDLIRLGPDILKLVMDHVKDYSDTYRKNGRSIEKFYRDIFLGKLAEFALKSFYGDRITNVYLGDTEDPGYDFRFVDTGKTIDVKQFGFNERQQVIYINDKRGFIPDFYAVLRLVDISSEGAIFDYYGMCPGDYVNKRKTMRHEGIKSYSFVTCGIFNVK